jgi:hypothetical protein
MVAPAPQEHGTADAARYSRSAIVSLCLGIVSFVCFLFTGIPAIIFGVMGLNEVSRSRGRKVGTGIAIAGLIMGSLGSVGSLCLFPAVGLLLPAFTKVQGAAKKMQAMNNLKQIVVAMHNYHQVNGRFPPAIVYSKDGKPLYSWRVLLLPYLPGVKLPEEFKLDEPWDSPHNIKLLSSMPQVYGDPNLGSAGSGQTIFEVFVGKGTAFESGQGEAMNSFTDGTSNTILIVESANPVEWTKPTELAYAPDKPLPKLGGHHPDRIITAMADGSAHALPASISEKDLRALITRDGGEEVTIPP